MTPHVHHRVKGPAAIVRSLRGLHLRVHRFGRCRARTPDDRRWAALLLDQLQIALNVAAKYQRAAVAGPRPAQRAATDRSRKTSGDVTVNDRQAGG